MRRRGIIKRELQIAAGSFYELVIRISNFPGDWTGLNPLLFFLFSFLSPPFGVRQIETVYFSLEARG